MRIEEGRIVELSATSADGPFSDDVVDLEGRTLMPGLIDAHAHLSSDISRSPGFGPPAALKGELPAPASSATSYWRRPHVCCWTLESFCARRWQL